MTPGATGVTLRSIGLSVYLPTLLFGLGQGAIAPVIALTARELGASVAVAGLVVAAAGIGELVGNVPAGTLTARIGERRAMLAATGLLAAALVACVVATSVWVLGAAIGATGLAAAAWGLARQAYLTEVVPFHLRARALSTLGGSNRIGAFIGPFLGAGAMSLMGTDGAYWVNLGAAALAAAVLVCLPDSRHRGIQYSGDNHSGSQQSDSPRPAGGGAGHTTVGVIRDHAPVLRTLGFAAMLVGAVRVSRLVVIPLWAERVGLDPATTSLVFGLSGAVDMLLFYPAGQVMDRYGRQWVAVPSMLVLAAAHLLLPLTGGLATLSAVAVLMGIGNGMGSGLIMTIGADLSPARGRPEFLGAWRLCAATGTAAGPLVVSGVTALATLGPAILVMGAGGLAAAWAMGRWVPVHSPHRRAGHLR